MLRITLTTALLFLLHTFTLAEPNWKVLEPEDAGFSVVLPGSTEHSSSSADTFLGPIVAHSFYVSDPNATCTVVYTDLPNGALVLAGKDRIYKEARNEILRRSGGNIDTYQKIDSLSQSGRLLTYTGPDRIGRAEMFLVRNRLYVVDVFTPISAESGTSNKIFDSFKLIKSVSLR